MLPDRTARVPPLFASAFGLLLGMTACGGDAASGGADASDAAVPFEVWLVDQSDSDPEGRSGGRIHIFAGADLEADPRGASATETVDLAGATAELCVSETGAAPVRPHMLLFNEEGTHGALAFVGSGHVVILDAGARSPLRCFRMSPGTGGAQQAHAAFPSADGTFILVANQNGKLLERIDVDYAAGTFVHNTTATLDLANGTTPAGAPVQDPVLRPDNAPICPVMDRDSRYAWVTLRGGGLLVVDVRSTPMRIVGEYDRETVHGNGCGGVQVGDRMFVNSGGAPVNLQGEEHPVIHLYGFDVYRFPVTGYSADAGPNLPAPEVVFRAEGERDSHGMAAVRGDRYLWVADRHADVFEVLSADSGDHVATVELAGPLSANPAPDLVDVSPSGDLLLVALRGPTPLTGDPHNATGTTPGLGVVRVSPEGTGGELVAVLGISNPVDGREMADAHAVRVRPLR
jgi:hypothetical protein